MDINTNRYTETPPPSEPPAYNAQPKKKRSSRPLLVVLLCVVVAVLAGAASVLGYKMLYPQKAADTTTSSAPVEKTSTTITASILISGLKSQLKSPVIPTEVSGTNNVIVTGTDYGVDGAPLEQATGSDFFTAPAAFSRVTVASSSSQTLMNDLQTAETYFLGQHLMLDSVNYSGAQSGITAGFHNDTTVCSLSQTVEPWPQGSNQLTANCADLTSYQTTATALKPVFTAFTKAQPAAKVAGVSFQGQIASSKTSGYRVANINTGNMFSIGGSVALLYQTPDGTWHYFQNTQNILSCSAYKTSDLQKAFAGTACAAVNGQESKVGA